MRKTAGKYLSVTLLCIGIVFSSSILMGESMIVKLQNGKRYEAYVIQKGDTVWGIAEQKLSDPSQWNTIIVPDTYVPTRTPRLIYPGRLLFIPLPENTSGTVEKEPGEGMPHENGVSKGSHDNLGKIAVANFKNAGDTSYDWLGTGLAESITTDLAKIPGMDIVERLQVEGLRQEQKLKALSMKDSLLAQEFGRKLGADQILAGTYRVSKEQVEINAAIIDVKNGVPLETAVVKGKLGRIFELERTLLVKLFGELADISEEVQSSILAGETINVDAFKQASLGKSLFYLGQSQDAREYYQKALEIDPKYKAVLDDLKNSISTADTLAIMPFTNATGQSKFEWLTKGMAESLSTDLRKLTSIALVERVQIEKALEELKLGSMGGMVDEATAPKLGKLLGAGIVLVGSYQVMHETIRADVRMVDVGTSQILLTETASGNVDNIFEVEARIAEKIAAALHVNLTSVQKENLLAEKPDIESFKRYIMAQGSIEVVTKEPAKGNALIRAIALTNFTNANGNAEYDWLSAAIPGSLSTDLRTKSKISLVERTVLDKALEEMKLASIGLVSKENAPQIGKLVGADAVLTGLYQISGDSIRIDATIVKVETGEVLSGGKVSGNVVNIFELEKNLATEILIALGVESPNKEAEQSIDGAEDPTSLKPKRTIGYAEELMLLKKKQKELKNADAILNLNLWLVTVH